MNVLLSLETRSPHSVTNLSVFVHSLNRERIIPREGISDATRTITCIAEQKPTNTFVCMKEILVNCGFQVSKRLAGTDRLVPAKISDNVAPLPGLLNAYWSEITCRANQIELTPSHIHAQPLYNITNRISFSRLSRVTYQSSEGVIEV